ncbi:LpxI family protein [Seleniivibrio woodruffii]|uniref:LpxI family protein n=1 Tax=Seleniivibrio woodruffii TaxID=1078050 RepID=UPI0024096BC8|nr:UDP-2,3-diacylglucosamine diphosphatase LpxI [Seleniivibrio woodruffii]
MKVAVVAGYGVLPKLAAENLLKKGHSVLVVALDEAVSIGFSDVQGIDLEKISVTQIGKLLKLLKKYNTESVLFAGKVNKTLIYSNLKFDLLAVKILAGLRNRKDDTVMDAVCKLITENGMQIMDQTYALDSLYLEKGIYTKKRPTKEQEEDIAFGYDTAKELGRLDIGQTVVIKNKAVMALEAIEGTDLAIERGCKLAKEGAVVVKCAKPSQDLRFDIPTVGVDTLKILSDNNGVVLAVEAGRTFVVDIDKCIRFADENNIVIVAI